MIRGSIIAHVAVAVAKPNIVLMALDDIGLEMSVIMDPISPVHTLMNWQ